MRGSRSSSSAPAPPASRWPARSRSWRGTPCGATSARSIRDGARILLVEAADRVLTSFPPSLSAKAERSLERLGVTVVTGRSVIEVDAAGVTLDGGDAGAERIASHAVVWAAGIAASGLAGRLAELTGAERDRAGRVTVEPDLTLPGHPEVFAIGDMVRVRDGERRARPPSGCRARRNAARAVRGPHRPRAAAGT